jgi:hypothetical protein
MKKIIKLSTLILFIIVFPFIILTISYNTQDLYSGGYQDAYEFLMILIGVFGTIAIIFVIMFIDDITEWGNKQ